MQCEICGNFFASTGGNTYNGKFVCDNCQLIIKALGGEVGNMLKATYDTDDSGVVDDAEDSQKLDGSTKAGVRDHTPKAHTLASHSTKAHSELTGVGTDDHHAQAHTLASHSSKAHSELTGIGANDHHNEVHTHVEADIIDLDHDDADAIHDNVAAEINAIAEKGTPVDADLLLIEDSAAANAKKKVQIGNLPGGAAGATFVVSGAQAYSGNSPNSWTDLDLSSIVGSNSAMVILAIKCPSDINAVAVRKNGDTEEYYGNSCEANAYGCALGHHDNAAVLVLICVTDTAGIIEWKAEGILSSVTIEVIAYIK